MTNCIFCSIIAGDIPCHRIYEDQHCIAFLDINPINPGHTLLIPKQHIPNFHQSPIDIWLHLSTITHKIAQKQQTVYESAKIGIHIEGFEVDHTHIHIYPLYSVADKKTLAGQSTIDHTKLAQEAKKMTIN